MATERTALIPSPLVRLEKAVAMLAEARTLDEVKRIRAMAAAAEQYAKAEKLGDEAVRYATEIKIRAARKAGELLIAMAKGGERSAPGARGVGKGVKSHDGISLPTLDDIGVTPKQSSRWQNLARIPEPAFERLVRGEKPTERQIARSARPAPPGFDDRSMERRGAFRRLCRDMVALGEPKAVIREFSAHDHDGSLLDGARSAAQWLGTLLKDWSK